MLKCLLEGGHRLVSLLQDRHGGGRRVHRAILPTCHTCIVKLAREASVACPRRTFSVTKPHARLSFPTMIGLYTRVVASEHVGECGKLLLN